MAYVPYYINVNGRRLRDPKRQYVDTNTGEIVSRYQQLKAHYGGITPENMAKVRSGEYNREGGHSKLYDKAFTQWQKHNPDAYIHEWNDLANDLFSHYPGTKAGNRTAWEKRMEAIKELWYIHGEELDSGDFRDYISPEQGRK